jgi:hypothetical protein
MRIMTIKAGKSILAVTNKLYVAGAMSPRSPKVRIWPDFLEWDELDSPRAKKPKPMNEVCLGSALTSEPAFNHCACLRAHSVSPGLGRGGWGMKLGGRCSRTKLWNVHRGVRGCARRAARSAGAAYRTARTWVRGLGQGPCPVGLFSP